MDFTLASTWAVIHYASDWVIRIVMLVVVPFRRSPEAAKGWLLLIFFFPLPGLILYLVIGRPTHPRWRRERFARLPQVFAPVVERLQRSLTEFRPKVAPAIAAAANFIKNLGHLSILGENQVEILTDYDGAIDRLRADIDTATDHVHLLYYIFTDDAAGTKVIDALARASQRGVTCRVLVDDLGSRRWLRSVRKKLTAAGVAVHRVLRVQFWKLFRARADLRNHRKIAVIDGRIGYTGSQNLVDSAFKPWITYEELVVRVEGPVVLQLQAVFAADWYVKTEEMLDGANVFPVPQARGAMAAQVLPSGPDFETTNVQRFVVALTHEARRRVVITTPYFIPDDALLQALTTAVQRGVEVHLIVSLLVDQYLVSLAQRSYYDELLEAGVKIHRYRERFLHAKHVSFDDSVALIGSSNMDIRSFVLNAEVSLVVFDHDLVARLRVEQERYFADSELLSAAEWEKRPFASKVVENLARLMSPLL